MKAALIFWCSDVSSLPVAFNTNSSCVPVCLEGILTNTNTEKKKDQKHICKQPDSCITLLLVFHC